jgi:Zn-dependent protease
VGSAIPEGGVMYRLNSSRASYGELWRDARSPLVLILWLSKLLRARLPGSVNDPNVESLRPFEVPISSIPAEFRAKMDTELAELASAGFDTTDPVCHALIDLLSKSRCYMAAVWRADGRAVARVHVRQEGVQVPPKTRVHCDVLTELSGNEFLWTTSAKATLDAPAGVLVRQHIKLPARHLWDAHQRELQATGGRRTIVPAPTLAAAADLLERHHARIRDFHLQRGLFVPMSETDRQSAVQMNQLFTQAAVEGFSHPGVMAELQKLQNKKSSWVSGVVVLLISMGLFVGAGVPGTEGRGERMWEALALLVPILLFHELGHFLAMRIFGYRNLRMFFIPFLGAAVTGQNYTAPGWKKVIVALMGPLPGILVGMIAAIAGIVLQNALLMKVALFTLILNGLNLIPLLPLDGGRVVQTLLFSRHYAMDIVFRAIAGVSIIGIGMALGDRFFPILGVVMLIGIPVAWKLGRIAQDLRRQGLPSPQPANDQSIPPDSARVIIDRVKAAFPAGMNSQNKIAAQHTLSVYEMICSRPPGWAATIGLLILHGGGMVAAIVMAMIVVVAQRGDLTGFFRAAALSPRTSISSAQIELARGPARPDPPASAPTTTALDELLPQRDPIIVANFKKLAPARDAFDSLRSRVGPGEVLERFGQTLLVSVPDSDDLARQRWLSDLEARTSDVSVATGEYGSVGLTLTCVAPSEQVATEIVADCDPYLQSHFMMRLMPPWDPQLSSIPEAQRSQQRLARQTYTQMFLLGTDWKKDPRGAELTKRLADARRQGDRKQMNAVIQEQGKLMREARQRDAQRLRESRDGSVDPIVVEKYFEVFPLDPVATTGPTDEDAEEYSSRMDLKFPAYRALAERMGQIRLIDGTKPAPGADWYVAHNGRVSRNGLLISFRWLSFSYPVEGAPALVKWLEAKGCLSIKYSFWNSAANQGF